MTGSWEGKKVGIIGFGLEGKDAASFFLKEGAVVTIFDQRPKTDLDLEGFNEKDVDWVLGDNYLSDLTKFNILVRSPGVYPYKKELIEAQDDAVIVTSAIKLFFDLCPAKIIGVTGTKGKGTTSTLIYEILKTSGKDVYLAGNIGTSYLSLLPKLNPNSWVVLEISSFQLIDLHKSPHIAVVLNITTDHLDWHKDRKEYVHAKTHIVEHQTQDDFAVINYDYADSRMFEKHAHSKVYFFSSKEVVKGAFIKNHSIYLSTGAEEILIGETGELKLPGTHNWENVSAAVCASALAGADIPSIKQTVFAFTGLEHRLELVAELKSVKFYNDSFSTNPQTTIAAVKSFTEPLTLILGGSDKGLIYDEMAREIIKTGNVYTLILIGDIRAKIKASFKKFGYRGRILDLGKPTMGDILREALKLTPSGVVLLSPATASFDMFANYKDRGKAFKNGVMNLKSTIAK